MNPKDKVRIFHIHEAISLIEQFTNEIDFDVFNTNELIKAAVIREFEIIGESATNLTIGFKKKYFTIDWEKLTRFRNVLIHEYFRVDTSTLWATIQVELPLLKEEIKVIITESI